MISVGQVLLRKFGAAFALGAFLLSDPVPAGAQGWPTWADDVFGRPWGYDREPYRRGPDQAQPREPRRPGSEGGGVRDGGGRPEIAAEAPPLVAFGYEFPANSIVIDTGGRKLYYVLTDKRAYEYAISVGREGFNWAGTETISRKQAWPDWHPPAEMRERDPKLPEKMTGGLNNPLGAMALYLGNTLYRIHGTNDAKSIGRAASSGCFRMLNSHIVHLASMAEVGTIVNVVASLPRGQEISRASEPEAQPRAFRQPPAGDRPAVPSETAPNYRALRDYTLGGR